MSVEKVMSYMTPDGCLFSNEREAERHTIFLRDKEAIGLFLESEYNPYQSVTQKALVRNAIINYELWRKKQNDRRGD